MDNFVAIDVETANNHPTSICAIGAVKVVDGVIADRFYTLVQPYPNFYFRHFTQNIHGISRELTDSAPLFPDIYPLLRKFIDNMPLVAHNAPFDSACIKATITHYSLSPLPSQFLCTLAAARRTIPRTLCSSHSLPSLCHFLGIPFSNHHNAAADAEACAKIALTIL